MIVKSNSPESLWNHIEDLRLTITQIFGIILIGIIVSFLFYPKIIEDLTAAIKTDQKTLIHQEMRREKILNNSDKDYLYPLPDKAHLIYLSPATEEIKSNIYSIPPEGYLIVDKVISNELMLFGPTEGILITFKLCFWLGLVGTSPIWLFFLLRFVSPALNTHEKSLLIPFISLSLCFLTMGLVFAYFITIPFTNEYLASFNQTLGINLWSLTNYLDYVIQLLLSTAFAFEIVVIGIFLIHFHIITEEKMVVHRRYAVVGVLILGALLTPPDIFSQFMLALPLMGFYEMLILYAKSKRKLQTSLKVKETNFLVKE